MPNVRLIIPVTQRMFDDLVEADYQDQDTESRILKQVTAEASRQYPLMALRCKHLQMEPSEMTNRRMSNAPHHPHHRHHAGDV